MVRGMKCKRTLTECWLWLAVTAIATAGLYALVPVIGRTPQLKELGVMQRFFDVALVIHVDLSVLVWFLSMICMGASWLMERQPGRFPYWQRAGFACVLLATVLMALSPLGYWQPVKSNYIPVLHNGMFLLSLGLLTAGVMATLIPSLCTYLQPKQFRTMKPIGLLCLTAQGAVMLGLAGYALGGYALPKGLELHEHYERLFWAGGHIMQFAFTLLVMGAWLILLDALGGNMPSRKLTLFMVGLTLLGAIISLAGFVLYPFDDGMFTYFQTRVMIEWGGVGVVLMLLFVCRQLLFLNWPANPARPAIVAGKRAYVSALIVSMILFLGGGALGLMIAGQNVTIPAHYHGMITGITQALMGVAYVTLPRFGFRPVGGTRLAFWQPIIYGAGQLMHIGGLAYCGGYGILRKTAGGFENLAPDIKIALGIFGLGGLLAITGGILFVIVMLRAKREN